MWLPVLREKQGKSLYPSQSSKLRSIYTWLKLFKNVTQAALTSLTIALIFPIVCSILAAGRLFSKLLTCERLKIVGKPNFLENPVPTRPEDISKCDALERDLCRLHRVITCDITLARQDIKRNTFR